MLRPFHYAAAQQHQHQRQPSPPPAPGSSSGATGSHRHRRSTSISSPLSTSYSSLTAVRATPSPSSSTTAVPPDVDPSTAKATATSSLLAATRSPRGRSASSHARHPSDQRRRASMGVVKQELVLVDNHGAGTHYVCGDQDGVEGPADPVVEFDEVGFGRSTCDWIVGLRAELSLRRGRRCRSSRNPYGTSDRRMSSSSEVSGITRSNREKTGSWARASFRPSTRSGGSRARL